MNAFLSSSEISDRPTAKTKCDPGSVTRRHRKATPAGIVEFVPVSGIPQLAIPRSTLERQPLTRSSDDSVSPEIIRSAEQMRHVNQG